MSPASGAELGEASFVTWDDTSFTINWSTVPNVETSIFAMVLAGEDWVAEVGTFTNTNSISQKVPTVDNTGIWQGGLFYHNNEDISQPSVWGLGFNLGFWHRDDSESSTSPSFVNKTKGYEGETGTDDQAQHSSPVSSLTVIDGLGNLEFEGKVFGTRSGKFYIEWETTSAEIYDFGYIVFHGEDIVISVGEALIASGASDITPLPNNFPRALITIDNGTWNGRFHGQGDITFSLGMSELASDSDSSQGVVYFGREFAGIGANVNGLVAEDRIIQHGDIVNNALLGDVVRVEEPDTSDYFSLDLLDDPNASFYFLSIGETK